MRGVGGAERGRGRVNKALQGGRTHLAPGEARTRIGQNVSQCRSPTLIQGTVLSMATQPSELELAGDEDVVEPLVGY